MKDQEILDNAPVYWIGEKTAYVSLDEEIYFKWNGFDWLGFEQGIEFVCYETPITRSLADIKRIINLERELYKAKAKVKNQKTELTNLNAALKESKK
jgi:hypothetical protein